MTEGRRHTCGEPMDRGTMSNHSPVPRHRSQPIWSCWRCSAWEPHEDWRGELPDGWDGQRWATPAGEVA